MSPDDKYEYERRLKLFGTYTRDDLKRAYKRAAKSCHPDIASFHGIPRELAEENMKLVNESFGELSRLFDAFPLNDAIISDYTPEEEMANAGCFVFDDQVYPGALLEFGRYPLQRDHVLRPLVWYVISVEDNEAVLITDQCVDCRPFHSRRGHITWASSDIRTWLNTVFFDRAFSKEEAEVVVNTALCNSSYNEFGISGGRDTVDKVYLLSPDEARSLFANWRDLATTATEFAEERGSETDIDGQCFWWLRTPGRVDDAISYVEPGGYIHDYDGRTAVSEGYSVRPVIRIRLKRRYRDSLERETQRARKQAADLKERSEQAAKDEEERAKRKQEEEERIAFNKEEEERAAKSGYTPFESTPSIGQIVLFGRYPDESPIRWRVLSVDGTTATLISVDTVSRRPFAYDASRSRWTESLLKEWLNGDFLEHSFTPTERAAILRRSDTAISSQNSEKVFILSVEEAEQLFSSNEDRIAYPSEYAIESEDLLVDRQSWWLRDNGSFGDTFVSTVMPNGKILRIGLSCSDSGVSVRPAIQVKC